MPVLGAVLYRIALRSPALSSLQGRALHFVFFREGDFFFFFFFFGACIPLYALPICMYTYYTPIYYTHIHILEVVCISK